LGIVIRFEIFHASAFGNGKRVAEELGRILKEKGHQAEVHHIEDAKPKDLPPADIYVFGCPTRFGGPIGSMRRFVKKADLATGTRYALFATHSEVLPNKRTGIMPSEDEISRMRRTIPTLDDMLSEKGLVKITDKVFLVSGEEMKGHLLDGWQQKVVEFAQAIVDRAGAAPNP
jgi:flavodoxin